MSAASKDKDGNLIFTASIEGQDHTIATVAPDGSTGASTADMLDVASALQRAATTAKRLQAQHNTAQREAAIEQLKEQVSPELLEQAGLKV